MRNPGFFFIWRCRHLPLYSSGIPHLYRFDTQHQKTTIFRLNHETVNEKKSDRTSVLMFNSLITKHSRRGNLTDAKAVFDGMPFRNVTSWTAMLTACAENGEIENARKLFDTMPQRNLITWNAMMSAYISNRRLGVAYQLFRCMPERNSISWTCCVGIASMRLKQR
uniref:Pentacotripeptide-repeat region of PRORP domain-containing protein n=1 Tax=Nymphaea colorata TaxID=210225 RepID=A0A5K1G722_9MAGN